MCDIKENDNENEVHSQSSTTVKGENISSDDLKNREQVYI